MKAVMAFSRNIVDNRVAGRPYIVQHIGRKFQVFALDDDPDLLHRMKRETLMVLVLQAVKHISYWSYKGWRIRFLKGTQSRFGR